ncbi:zinc-ribbon domain-containing protein [Maribacter luteus]|uniref:Zinc-ribbon domain-containing protein n=1 Tax=Maribacter luteus TaxID=2594478 RepID=A0A6I2MTI6_9FLAO|nr:zinc-ribbon domain-containing protein [Maribacter luteus]MRX65790.1 zinc-ribbon domain-containing protein [Maribacter luteus]
MILFFGTRPGKEQIRKLTNVKCSFCEQTNTLTAYIRSNYFHLFWIKLFKISTSEVIECSHCKRVYYKEEFTEEMKDALNRKVLIE